MQSASNIAPSSTHPLLNPSADARPVQNPLHQLNYKPSNWKTAYRLQINRIRKDYRMLLQTDYTEWRSGVQDLALVQNQSSKNLTSKMLQRFTFLEVSWFEKLCKNDDRTKGAISLLENLKECFSKVFILINLKLMILIPLNTQNQFQKLLSCQNSINWTNHSKFDPVKVFSCNSHNCISVVTEITVTFNRLF